jgi:hypothetical protein
MARIARMKERLCRQFGVILIILISCYFFLEQDGQDSQDEREVL